MEYNRTLASEELELFKLNINILSLYNSPSKMEILFLLSDEYFLLFE